MGGVRNQSGLVKCPNCGHDTAFFLVGAFHCEWCGYHLRGLGDAWYGLGDDPTAHMNAVQGGGPNKLPPNPKQIYGDAKVPLAFVPPSSVIYEALALQDGARKYGPYNWRHNGVEVMTYVHAAIRHLYQYLDGEFIDPASGKPHLGHAKACIGIVIDSHEHGNLIDNRPPPSSASRLLDQWHRPVPAPANAPTPYEQANAVHAEDQLFDDVVVDACARAGAMKLGR